MASQNQTAGGPIIFTGMGRNNHPINQQQNILWDAHNIRLTSRDGESLLSVTNEKSSVSILNFYVEGLKTSYIGHIVAGDYLIVLLQYKKDDDAIDVICRIDLSADEWIKKVLYIGDLSFDPTHPAQIIADFETTIIQKIYWVDEINSPRLINITKPELKEADYDDTSYSDDFAIPLGYSAIYTDAPFDFVPSMRLTEKCTITRQDGVAGGLFPAGVIQYVLTYSFKYGQESNPFYTSELLYTSYKDRGGSVEDSINNAFKIEVDNIESRFDYINIYSILRTELNGTATVKQVIKIDLEEIEDGSSISYIDTNTTGETVDENYLLFSNRDITVKNIFAKDNVLFLGNIKYNRTDINSVLSSVLNTVGEDPIISILHNTNYMLLEKKFDYSNNSNGYVYVNQLSQNTSYFRGGEEYRLGVQFQYKTGEWSEPVFLKDYTVEEDAKPYFKVDEDNQSFSLFLPAIADYVFSPEELLNDVKNGSDTYTESNYSALNQLYELGYRNIRAVVVFPEDYERNVLAQGVVNPTVFQVGARKNNAPHSISSWIFRPMGTDPTINTNVGLDGSVAEWRHLHPLVAGRSSAAEIQNMAIAEDWSEDIEEGDKLRVLADYEFWQEILGGDDHVLLSDDLCNNYFSLATARKGINNNVSSVKGIWYVDQSICTFHSPDVEFMDSKKLLFYDNITSTINYAGLVNFDRVFSDIEITLKTVQADPDAIGLLTTSNVGSTGNGFISGLFFKDGLMDDFKDTGASIMLSEYDDSDSKHGIRAWLVSLWHRTGSLNNDCVRPITDTGTRTAEIETKIISNMRIANDSYWFTESSKNNLNNLDVDILTLFDSEEIIPSRIPDSNNDRGQEYYFGNLDLLNPSYTAFKLVCSISGRSYYSLGDITEIFFTGTLTRLSDNVTINLENYPMTYNYMLESGGYHKYYVTLSGDEWANITINEETISLQNITVIFYYYIFNDQYSSSHPSQITLDGITYQLTPNQYGITIEDGTNIDDVISESGYITTWEKFSYNETLNYLQFGDGLYASGVNNDSYLGDYYTTIVYSKDGVRMKFKSTPHIVFGFNYTDNYYRQSLPILTSIGDSFSITEEYVVYTPYNTALSKVTIQSQDQYWLSTTNDSKITYNAITLSTNNFLYDNYPDLTSYLWLCEIRQSSENKFGGATKDALLNNSWLPAGEIVSIQDLIENRDSCVKAYTSIINAVNSNFVEKKTVYNNLNTLYSYIKTAYNTVIKTYIDYEDTSEFFDTINSYYETIETYLNAFQDNYDIIADLITDYSSYIIYVNSYLSSITDFISVWKNYLEDLETYTEAWNTYQEELTEYNNTIATGTTALYSDELAAEEEALEALIESASAYTEVKDQYEGAITYLEESYGAPDTISNLLTTSEALISVAQNYVATLQALIDKVNQLIEDYSLTDYEGYMDGYQTQIDKITATIEEISSTDGVLTKANSYFEESEETEVFTDQAKAAYAKLIEAIDNLLAYLVYDSATDEDAEGEEYWITVTDITNLLDDVKEICSIIYKETTTLTEPTWATTQPTVPESFEETMEVLESATITAPTYNSTLTDDEIIEKAGIEAIPILWQWGDTWYQRYDCLKTYCYSSEDVNQVVEIGSFWVETNVNIDGRYDKNRGLLDNTIMTPNNFNLINEVYSQKNNFFTYSILDEDYYKITEYPSQLYWSLTKSPGAVYDNWTKTHMATSLDFDGSKGSLTAVVSFYDKLFAFQERTIQQINFNARAILESGDGVPVEIAQNAKVDGYQKAYDLGCQDKFSILTNANGMYFIDNRTYKLYVLDSEKMQPLSENMGVRFWLKENHADLTWRMDAEGEGNNGIRLFYDPKYQDVYFVPGLTNGLDEEPKEALCFNEQISAFTSLLSYGGSVMFDYDGKQYAITYSHENTDKLILYEIHSEEATSYNQIFDEEYPFSLSFIFNDSSYGVTKIIDNIEMRADCYDYNEETGEFELVGGNYNIVEQGGMPFDHIRIENEYQDSGDVAFTASTLRKKYRIWRGQIPREEDSRNRINNMWSKITLSKESPGTSLTILHNLNVLTTY